MAAQMRNKQINGHHGDVGLFEPRNYMLNGVYTFRILYDIM